MTQEGYKEKSASTLVSPSVWAVGGGKGGVGKSVISANLAVALAKEGKRCVLLDADLGGANLHTLFGITNPQSSLADLFQRQRSSLQDLLIPTPVPNLHLISGGKPLLDMANPHHAQKLKIIRQIFTLKVDHILIDLGAGSTFNVLDFFLAASGQLVVVAPMPTSVENAYHFLKTAFFRKLKRVVREVGMAAPADRALRNRWELGIRSPREFVAHLQGLDREKGESIALGMQSFQPKIIVNQIRREAEMSLGPQMALAASNYFGTEIGFLGSIRNDDRVHHAVQGKRPVAEVFPQCSFSLAVRDLTRRLLGVEEDPLERHSTRRSI